MSTPAERAKEHEYQRMYDKRAAERRRSEEVYRLVYWLRNDRKRSFEQIKKIATRADKYPSVGGRLIALMWRETMSTPEQMMEPTQYGPFGLG